MIEIENLFFSYTNAPPFVLEDINLTVRDGEYISVLGENGSGKSTLIRLILRLLRPTRGRLGNTAARVGYLPQRQDAAASHFPITVYEMLNCYRHLLRVRDPSAVMQCLDMVKMGDYRNALIGNLSGGQCQKVFIARALLGDPGLLVLDEPSTGVDTGSQREIYELIRRLNHDRGITVLSIEHNLEAAMENSTMIYHLANGSGHLCTPEKYAEEFMGRGRPGGPF